MGTDEQPPPSMFAASAVYHPVYIVFFFNLKILRQQTQAWRNCILQMRPLFHVRHTSNRSPQKQYGSYTILTVAFCVATKALSKSPNSWWLIGSANPLKISNIVLTLMKQSPYWQIHQIKFTVTNTTVLYIIACILSLNPRNNDTRFIPEICIQKASSSSRGFRMRRVWWHFNRQRLRCGQRFKLVCSRRIWTCQSCGKGDG